MDSIIDKLPKMLVGEKLYEKSLALPDYDVSIRLKDAGERLIALSDLYSIYIPSDMSAEIYCKLYLALVRSLQKKNTTDTIRQLNENHKMMQKQAHNGIIGGTDCFIITGCSGIGKSSAIYRAIDIIGVNGVVETHKPYRKIIPLVVVQTPFDCSVKGLLLEILRQVDEQIGSDYYVKGMRARVTTDEILYKALIDSPLFSTLKKCEFQTIEISEGDILKISPDSTIKKQSFDYSCCYSKNWWDYGRYPYVSILGDSYGSKNDYVDDLKAIASFQGVDESTIDDLLSQGFTPQEIEEYIYEF